MRRLIARLAKNDRGATAIEYGLICAVVFLVAVGAMTDFGNAATSMFNKVATTVDGSMK